MFAKPTRIAQELFGTHSKTRVKKIVSGAQHTLALSQDGKVFAWGDKESGKLGRIFVDSSRAKAHEPMKILTVGARKAIDIFTGNHHSFYMNDKKQVFAWGLNNHG